MFSFTWDVIFKLFLTLILASFPLSLLFGRVNSVLNTYRRRLDDMYESLKALQHHLLVILITLLLHPKFTNYIHSLQLNPVVPAAVHDIRYSLPIAARAEMVRSEAAARQAEAAARQAEAEAQDREAEVRLVEQAQQ